MYTITCFINVHVPYYHTMYMYMYMLFTLSFKLEANTTGVIAPAPGVAPPCPKVAARATRN